MEHLPYIEDPAFTLPSVPYLGDLIAYDGCGFHGFPRRHGWIVTDNLYRFERDAPRNIDPALQTPENLAAFVQAWLYFGVLHELFNVILDLNVSLEDFTNARDGQVFLTTSQLRRHIRSWEDKQGDIDRDHYSGRKLMEESHFEELHSALAKVLIKVTDFFHRYTPHPDLTWLAASIPTF
jgi:hypothetical protein